MSRKPRPDQDASTSDTERTVSELLTALRETDRLLAERRAALAWSEEWSSVTTELCDLRVDDKRRPTARNLRLRRRRAGAVRWSRMSVRPHPGRH